MAPGCLTSNICRGSAFLSGLSSSSGVCCEVPGMLLSQKELQSKAAVASCPKPDRKRYGFVRLKPHIRYNKALPGNCWCPEIGR